ncbi:MAG TPA: copper amine oxidase N-terminal domain-containing protein [Thermoanaerobacterales bacterium]|nr:copper amine oxidase N-terminal domain-containing protein [Thermoanaerobacterales bacterium]
MKRKLLPIIAIFLISVGIFTIAYAASPIKIILNGRELKVDVPPQNVNGRVLVPIRGYRKPSEPMYLGMRKTVRSG